MSVLKVRYTIFKDIIFKEEIIMLNTLDMYGICHEIYRDLKGKNAYAETDENILTFIFKLYNTTEIDCEEVKSLWIEWLTKGTLSVNTQIQNARNRNRKVPIAVLKAVEKFKLIDNIIMNSDYQDATAHPLWSEWERYTYTLVEQGWGYLIKAN